MLGGEPLVEVLPAARPPLADDGETKVEVKRRPPNVLMLEWICEGVAGEEVVVVVVAAVEEEAEEVKAEEKEKEEEEEVEREAGAEPRERFVETEVEVGEESGEETRDTEVVFVRVELVREEEGVGTPVGERKDTFGARMVERHKEESERASEKVRTR